MVEKEGIGTIKVEEKDADKAFLNIANKNTIIATNDVDLRKKLKNLGIKTIYLRARKHLAMS
jgi:rRNA-processing protein FCF1